jgi:hypothetical protein
MIRRSVPKRQTTDCPKVYIGFSTGINNTVGLIGPQVDFAITPAVSIGTGFGLSSWGYKTFIEGRYYFKPCNRGWAVAGGFTYNTGGGDIPLTLETIYGDRGVIVDLKPQPNFMFSGYHFFNLGRSGRNRFHLQAGYSIPLKTPEFTVTSGEVLTKKGHDVVIAIAPGGLILGLGFSFGIGGK